MTPMFVETQRSQGPESVAASQSGGLMGKIRATQSSLEFSQTQTAGTAISPYPGVGAALDGRVFCIESFEVKICIFTLICIYFPSRSPFSL